MNKNTPTPEYGMNTSFGDDAVEVIVRRAKKFMFDWPQVLADLQELSEINFHDFSEAMDSRIQESVYNSLGFKTPFYI
jgi:hypothetical protein